MPIVTFTNIKVHWIQRQYNSFLFGWVLMQSSNFNRIICYCIFCLMSTLVSIEMTKLYVCDNIWNVRRNHSLRQNLNMRNDTESIFIWLPLRKFNSYSNTQNKKNCRQLYQDGFFFFCMSYVCINEDWERENERKKFGTEKGCGFVQ